MASFNATETSGLSRRSFIGTVAAGAALAGFGAFAPERAHAAEPIPAENALYDKRGSAGPYATPSVTTLSEKEQESKRILVVVDYQVDFVSGGVKGTIEPALAIEDALYELVKEYQDAGDIVIYTMDTHPADDYANTREATVNEPHCVPGTEGWEIYGRLRELLTPEKAIRIMKGTYGSVDLPFVVESIRRQGVAIESIEIAGVSTTCRVLHNAILLYNFFPEAVLVMDARTTASYTDERTKEQLDELETWGFIIKR